MNRFFSFIKVSEYIIYVIVFISGWNILKSFGAIMNTDKSDGLLLIPFISNIILGVSCVFMMYNGKKYLYNFVYFEIPADINPFDNLTMEMPKFNDYEEVPDPVKLLVPVYIIFFFCGFSILSYLFIVFVPFFGVTDAFWIQTIDSIYSCIKSLPLLFFSIIPTQALLLYSITMYYQIKHYHKYYNILLKYCQEEIDMTEELHES